jgi:hypothetical protein
MGPAELAPHTESEASSQRPQFHGSSLARERVRTCSGAQTVGELIADCKSELGEADSEGTER